MIEYAQNCPWRAGQSLARKMENGYFDSWQRVIIALNEDKIVGFCTFTKKDSFPYLAYTPFIGYIYVDEKHRGQQIGKNMIDIACQYAKSLQFEYVYIVTDHHHLYEKYGFEWIDQGYNRHGKKERIYRKGVG